LSAWPAKDIFLKPTLSSSILGQGPSTVPLTLANRITILRILAIPLFILLLMYYTNGIAKSQSVAMLRWCATGIFLGIFLLDAVDGYVARVRHEITGLGTILDPLADKAVLLSALILLSLPAAEAAFQPHLPTWFLLTAISRDAILVTGAAIIQIIMGAVTVHPRITGKIATFFQGAVVVWSLIGLPKTPFFWVLYTAAFFTLVSAVQYIFDGIRQLEKAK
jgi:CDP-diacylglycerol--glycerol-3-phosphate 3-phosphatidyltransferase